MPPPSSPSPTRRGVTRRQSLDLSAQATESADVVGWTATRPSTPSQLAVDVVDVMQMVEQAHSRSKRTQHVTFAAVEASQIAAHEVNPSDRPTTPDRDRPSTPQHPCTPLRLDQLESEFFDFSPNKSPGGDLLASISQSPSLTMLTSRAPLLRMGSMDDLLTNESSPSLFRSPGALPKTPKKSPFGTGVSAPYGPRITSPFGTPSRTGPRQSGIEDDELSSFFQSPSRFDAMFSGLPGLGSPSSHDRW